MTESIKVKVVVVVLVFISTILIILNFMQTRKLRECRKELVVMQQIEENKRTQEHFTYGANFQQQMLVEGMEWNNIPLLAPNKSKTTLMEEMSFKQPKLLVRISEIYCEECVHSMLLKLQRLSQELPLKNHVIILATYSNHADLKQVRSMVSDFPVYMLEHKVLSFPMEENMQPYCLILGSDMKVMHAFTPNKEVHHITNFYLKTVCQRYFTN